MDVFRSISHPYIVEMKEVYESKTHLYITMELMRDKELTRVIKNSGLSAIESTKIIHQILLAVKYLHDCGIVHCDLKPANIMVRNQWKINEDISIKIVDFGFSRWILPG